MAIQFARCAYISRSSGGNACRKAAYNARMTVTCERTGETFSYQTKGEAAYHEVLLSQGAHPKLGESSLLRNEAEFCEKRKDSQVAKEIALSLLISGSQVRSLSAHQGNPMLFKPLNTIRYELSSIHKSTR